MCSFADVCQFDVAMKTLRSPTFDSNPWLMQSCLSCQCTCRRTGCAVGVCGTCRSCLRHEDTPWFQKRNDEIWKRCTFANGSKVDCMHCMHCMQYASRIGSSAKKFSLSSDVQQGQLQAMRMHSTANCFGIPSCWLLKRIASVFTSKEPYEANAARGDCRCWACWLDCRNLSALSCNLASVADSWALFKCQINPDCLQKKMKYVRRYIIFLRNIPRFSQGLKIPCTNRKFLVTCFISDYQAPNIAMYALGNKSVCLCIIDFISSFTLGNKTTFFLFSARHYVVFLGSRVPEVYHIARCASDTFKVSKTFKKVAMREAICIHIGQALLLMASCKVASPRPSR